MIVCQHEDDKNKFTVIIEPEATVIENCIHDYLHTEAENRLYELITKGYILLLDEDFSV